MENSISGLTPILIIMGVSGCGKTVVGTQLAHRLGVEFFDGDQLHPKSNIDKMSSGIPLTDEDRWPWLDTITKTVLPFSKKNRLAVVTCSALRKTYRNYLREHLSGPIRFIHLVGTKQLIAQRLAARSGHFMPSHLIDSQFAALETPKKSENVVSIHIDDTVENIIAEIVAAIKPTNEIKSA